MTSKYYIYGCKQLLSDLKEIIDSAAEYEEQGKSAEEWIELNNVPHQSRRDITWGYAINKVIDHCTEQIEINEYRETGDQDYPF